MKFIDEADEIPEELLNAQKENKLVIFVRIVGTHLKRKVRKLF